MLSNESVMKKLHDSGYKIHIAGGMHSLITYITSGYGFADHLSVSYRSTGVRFD